MDILLPPSTTQPEVYIPVIAIRDGVVFPNTETVLTFGRHKSIIAVNEAVKSDKRVIFISQRHEAVTDPKASDLYSIGTLSIIDRTLKTNDEVNALVRGISRVKIEKYDDTGPFIRATFSMIPEIIEESPEVQALVRHLTNEFRRAVNIGKSVEFLNFMKLMSGANPSELADQIASTLELDTRKKQVLLETVDVKLRLQKIIDALAKEIKVLEIERNIASKTQKKFDKHMRETVLRERLKTIQKELGDGGADEEQEISELSAAIEEAGMPKKVKAKALKELKRLEQMQISSPEYSYIRTWLDTVIEMPWKKRSRGTLSLTKAEHILNEDHYGLKDVKERILEYLAVLKLKSQDKRRKETRKTPTILCFVGAPGVGKTSIGRSIAKAVGREFVKMSLGGIHDEAEIRGHRRTYVGAMPGRIIQGIRTAGTKNPVFMLDEIDKVGADFHGDPSSALLEALDPEQNNEFADHYLEVPFDLSEVMFITTANVLDTIPPALRDRLEIIPYSGYTEDEKFEIARRHLLKKVLEANGVTENRLEIPDAILRDVIKLYTREAGVRSLERQMGKVARKVAYKMAKGFTKKIRITPKMLDDFLGAPKYLPTLAEKKNEVGLATGLAWTPVGGDVLFIEVALMDGKGNVILTGQLGKVMQESARAALTYVKANATSLGISKSKLTKTDIHVHVPEGAVPKDGPSAGVTMTTAMISAFTNTPIKKDVAMTGEVTLRGKVLEIGGLKEKVIAAHRAGITHVIAPEANKKDMREIPEKVQKDITFHFASTVKDVLSWALAKKK
ncbi:MAG TPA: endopeptidase La [Candidatus Pacebacteria bacterium]|nr:MAG: Lon protease [Microgenomates group bacterium GW2011_GWB1_45_17]KKU23881.1 MAG: Lon protease [Microgenomates group bacterium GW2011_GWA1_46_15]KKU24726.1 MAG: Lon protease [Microgenomates group bacterium GW2011_GWC1_46_15]HAV15373.1 endopeptidase La [Candidatus Paceibacterota bacterium]HCR11569.1 endopeptidase La [Candidatus Paceibacterota bacterium]